MSGGETAASRLPDSPGALLHFQAPGQTPAQEGAVTTGTITGEVKDSHDGLVPSAKVHATEKITGATRDAISDSGGGFTLTLPAGIWTLTVSAKDLDSFQSDAIVLQSEQNYEVRNIILPLVGERVDAVVNAGGLELASEEMHAELQQRILGVLPNFDMSMNWTAASLNSKLKFELALRSATDPVAFFGVGIESAVQQAANAYPEYDQGWIGYAKRYGADLADQSISGLLGSGLLPSLLRQDPRYFYMGRGSTNKQRFLHALSSAILCRGDNGNTQINYSHLGGNFCGGVHFAGVSRKLEQQRPGAGFG